MVAFTSSIAALVLAAAGAKALPQNANDGFSPVPSTSPTFVGASWSGNGCPQGTVEFDPSDADQQGAGPVVFRRFYNAIGPEVDPTSKTKNCQAHFNVKNIESGWQFAVKNLKVRGYADFDQGITLTVYATSYFSQNARDTVTQQFSKVGAYKGGLAIDVPFDETTGPWSPCGSTGILNVNFRTAFTSSNRAANGYFGAGDGVPYVTESIEYVWRKCS